VVCLCVGRNSVTLTCPTGSDDIRCRPYPMTARFKINPATHGANAASKSCSRDSGGYVPAAYHVNWQGVHMSDCVQRQASGPIPVAGDGIRGSKEIYCLVKSLRVLNSVQVSTQNYCLDPMPLHEYLCVCPHLCVRSVHVIAWMHACTCG
jgi:hypothetical protein